MNQFKRITMTVVGVVLLIAGIIPVYAATDRQILQIITPIPQQGETGPLTQAVEKELASIRGSNPALRDSAAVIDAIRYSSDKQSALVYLALRDPVTGEILGSEPILAIAQYAPEIANSWSIIIQGDAEFTAALRTMPADLLDSEIRQRLIPESTAEPKAVLSTYGGYLLPWAAGLEKRLSMGANHVSCPTTCTYAFDFADGTMFPLLASKGGSVYHWKDTCVNGDTYCTNSITLEDRSTSPFTYQIYLHLQQNSIPAGLKHNGAPVVQGQFIGSVDDTGYSSGHHVHFMVITNPVLGNSGYMWGTSVDITFKDVSINWDPVTKGGRPCLLSDLGYGYCSQYQQKYISGNIGSNPPTGGLTTPAYGTVANARVIPVSGWGQDDLQVTKLQMMANYDGTWREVGPGQISTPFSFNLDLCEDQIPNGAVSLALRVYDYEGNFTILPLEARPILKNFSCASAPPAPTCTPNSEQVALFSEPDFSGTCQVLGVGSYANGSQLGSVGGDNTASIKVGQNVSASLFWSDDFSRRSETFTSSYPVPTLLDRNLADNLTSANTLSSLKVQQRTVLPSAPVLTAASSTKQLGTNPKSTDSIVLSWTGGGGASKYQAELYYGAVDGSPDRSTGFSTDQSWSIGNLPAGPYTWRVRGRVADYSLNPTSYYSSWSTATFTVEADSLPAQTALATPYIDTMESGDNGWTASGLWNRASLDAAGGGTTTAWIFNNGSDYADGSIRAGDLTSPPVALPAAPAVRYLRFDYRNQTESSQVYFDQRRVQISADGGAFQDLLSQPLNDEAMNAWLQSGPVSLAAYAGKTIRLRFHFDIVDPNWNDYTGWVVDNVSINDQPGAAAEIPENNSPAGAATLSYNTPLLSTMSPQGDVDYYRISASSGDFLQVDAVAAGLTPPSPLDTMLTLLDADGRSVLAENDDISPGANPDSRLVYMIRSTGTYYIKVKAWNHPGAGGPDYRYTITASLQTDTTSPTVSLSNIQSGGYIPSVPFTLTASATDGTGGSGIKQVSFYWHSSDWANGTLQVIGADTTSIDGWKMIFDPSQLAPGQKYSFFSLAEDQAGNSGAAAAWDVGIDGNLNPDLKYYYFPIIHR